MDPSQEIKKQTGQQYDIFKEDPGQTLLWIEVVTGLEEARKRLISLTSSGDRYRIFDPATATFVELAKKKSA